MVEKAIKCINTRRRGDDKLVQSVGCITGSLNPQNQVVKYLEQIFHKHNSSLSM